VGSICPLYLATKYRAAFFFPSTEGTHSTVERYSHGHGMSFGLEDQKPQPQAPQPVLGLFFPAGLLLSP